MQRLIAKTFARDAVFVVYVICCQLAFSWLALRFAARASSKQTRLPAARSVAERDERQAWRDAQGAGATSR
eukprot:1222243-Pleurochrysis_carterae.AAC.1